MRVTLSAVLALLVLAGCAGDDGEDPDLSAEATAREFVEALKEEDYARACELSVFPAYYNCRDALMRRPFGEDPRFIRFTPNRKDPDEGSFAVSGKTVERDSAGVTTHWGLYVDSREGTYKVLLPPAESVPPSASEPAEREPIGGSHEKRPPVLGSSEYMGAYGEGWGTVEPRRIYNGGVPNGDVRKIRWRGWSRDPARGRGKGWAYTPHGGYYEDRVRVQLVASHLGTCPRNDRLAYTTLRARMQKRPGGPFGRWFNWAGDDNICRRP